MGIITKLKNKHMKETLLRESCFAFIYLDVFDPNFAYLKAVVPLLLLLIPCKKDQDLVWIASSSSLLCGGRTAFNGFPSPSFKPSLDSPPLTHKQKTDLSQVL